MIGAIKAIKGELDYAVDYAIGSLHRFAGAEKKKHVVLRADPAFSRLFAIVCLYDITPRPDLRRLLVNLRSAGFYCVLVGSNDAPAQFEGLADAIISIGGYGRDFTAYKAGFEFLKERVPPEQSTIAFFNDSVWYFEKYQREIIDRLLASTAAGELCAGGFIADEVPHATGWLFAVPFSADWRAGLATLFEPNFVRRSSRYHVRFGEHRILPTMTRARSLTTLQEAGPDPAVAACYSALREGVACFYLKADSQLRTDVPSNHLAAFLDVNAGVDEKIEVLRWLAARSAVLLADRARAGEMAIYRARYFARR